MSRLFRKAGWKVFRAANIALRGGRRILGGGDVVVARRGGLRWELDLSETIDFSIFLTGGFQRATVEALVDVVREGDVVLDIGANIGSMALPVARAVGPRGRVVCFEPTAFAMRKLRRNIALNPDLAERVEARQLELVDTPGAAARSNQYSRWPIGRANGRHAGHHGVAEECVGAEAKTLDDFCEQAGLSRVDLVKLDVDGNECSVLRGATRMLNAFRPTMIVELQPSAFGCESPDRFEDMISLLEDAGYRLFELGRRRPLPMKADELRLLLPGDSVENAVAIHEGAP